MVRAEVDIYPHQQFAVMTALLVGVLAALEVHVLGLGVRAEEFLKAHGAVPHHLLALLDWRHPYRALSGLQAVVSSILLHANPVQLIANLTLLLLFGPSVEDRLGHYRFLLLFVFSGAVAVLGESLMRPESRIALVGAQGAVAGVGGACLAISPRGKVATMVRGVEFPWVLGPTTWLLVQVLLTAAPLPTPDGVAAPALPYVVLAYAVGVGLGPLYWRQRPALLRG